MISFSVNDFTVKLARPVNDFAANEWLSFAAHQIIYVLDADVGELQMYFSNSAPLDMAACQSWLNDFNSLVLTSDTPTILPDGVNQAVITCTDPAIAGETEVAVTVWKDDRIYASTQQVALAGGVLTLELQPAPGETGTFVVGVRRNGTLDTAFIIVESTNG